MIGQKWWRTGRVVVVRNKFAVVERWDFPELRENVEAQGASNTGDMQKVRIFNSFVF